VEAGGVLKRITTAAALVTAVALVIACATATAGPPVQAAVPRAHTSLSAIEQRVMCVTCKIPLMVADSPQAGRERAYIRSLIAQGLTVAQIERAMVEQYGPSVLGLPRASGFDLTAYVVPAAAVLALALTLALLLPRWRRRSRSAPAVPPPMGSADAARLDADMGRFDP
jgi:cytochrome c-type biogenesis protein CcmH